MRSPVRLKVRTSSVITIVLAATCMGLLAWSPWVTDDFATWTVVDHLGGPDQSYNYLGDFMPVGDVPKTVVRMPFCALVYFPGEAMYIVTFWGGVF